MKEQTMPTKEQPSIRLMRCQEVLSLIPIGRSTLYSWVSEGRFPKQVKRGKTSFWRSDAVLEWINNPANAQSLEPDIRRLAKRSALFRGDLSYFLEVSRLAELVVLITIQEQSRSIQIKPNAYDKSCLDRLEKRIAALNSGASSSLDLLKVWRP